MQLQTQQQQQQQIEAGIRLVFKAGDGCLTLIILGPASSVALIRDAAGGDAAARTVLAAADKLLRRIQRRSQARALPCLLCDDGTLWRHEAPGALAMLVPYGVESPRVAVGMAVCTGCAADRAELELAQMAVTRFRSTCMPGLRVFHPVAQAGHA